MKSKYKFGIILYILIFISACSSSDTPSEVSSKKDKLIIEAPSELAVLMKSMKKQSATISKALLVGDSIDVAFLEGWRSIHTAIPTEKDKKSPIYHGFADSFLSTVDSFKTVTNNRSLYFNNMISACVDCHRELCPGPVATISKLKIK